MLDLHYFAAARQAAGTAAEQVFAPATLRDLVAELGDAHAGTTAAGMPLADVLERCSFLLDGQGTDDLDASLEGISRVDVLPPFAGG